MKLHELRPPPGARRERRRIGRGHGSGQGTTAGKGTKGQKARSGGGVPPYFEGGQLPLVRRLPYRRGFRNPFRVEYAIVNVGQLARLADGTTVVAETLVDAGLLKKGEGPVKVLGDGEISIALHVHADRVSRQAREKIEAAGGSVEELRPRKEKAAPAEEPPATPARGRRRAEPSAAEAEAAKSAPAQSGSAEATPAESDPASAATEESQA
jgi:large subunit ribosomal protein L15